MLRLLGRRHDPLPELRRTELRRHLQSIYVNHGRGGAYELRCDWCYSSANTWKIFSWVAAAVLILVVIFLMAVH